MLAECWRQAALRAVSAIGMHFETVSNGSGLAECAKVETKTLPAIGHVQFNVY